LTNSKVFINKNKGLAYFSNFSNSKAPLYIYLKIKKRGYTDKKNNKKNKINYPYYCTIVLTN